MIKLVDIESVEEYTEFGTCEICSYSMDYIFEYFVFEDDKTGERRSILNGEWCWGDFGEYFYNLGQINICDLASFIKDKNIQTFDEMSEKLIPIVEEYAKINHIRV
ncbi:MAG: hypothetical protein E6147_06105 [Peptostreptococcus sp.]|uniref:hypothetical protein n=1 Tax=Peptostreptococcus sp. TaxID=1262 RepID=UPI00290AA570|nr:hypothetical protein [Peptostreptococcus sp.]MDU5350550.1 hypothetical protein [Peptostreptococcus sp.]MDU5891951.1 hypothetical protein [Peptostreptococcus sp.]